MKTVIIYKDQLLPYSETFIINQSKAVSGFKPFYVGSKYTEGIQLPPNSTRVVREKSNFSGYLNEILFKTIGYINPRLKKFFRDLKPVLVHAHFGVGGLLALPIAKYLKVPLIVTFHGFDATMKDKFVKKSFPTHRLYLLKRKQLIHSSATYIAVSNYIKSRMIEQGYLESKIIVHYIGIDTDDCKSVKKPFSQRENDVLFVGRLVEQKGCEHLIRAVATLKSAGYLIKLTVIGDGPELTNLKKISTDLNVRTTFLGRQLPQEVKMHMQNSKVLCVPSITMPDGRAEGLGMVFLEAQAEGVPVVSYDSGGISEAVIHNRTGFLAPEHDIQTLGSYIERLLNENILWTQMSQEAIQHVCNNFSIRSQIELLEKIYNDRIGEEN
jgi:colanic acid/amylovoran biosynthesis glycosyltransferase